MVIARAAATSLADTLVLPPHHCIIEFDAISVFIARNTAAPCIGCTSSNVADFQL